MTLLNSQLALVSVFLSVKQIIGTMRHLRAQVTQLSLKQDGLPKLNLLNWQCTEFTLFLTTWVWLTSFHFAFIRTFIGKFN